jgi:hypothetical protein
VIFKQDRAVVRLLFQAAIDKIGHAYRELSVLTRENIR